MALSASVLANLIETNLQGYGANGSNLSKFCIAVATGIVMSIVGQSFTTLDVGTVPGTGAGTGVGITGLSQSTMVNLALAVMVSRGSNAANLMNAIMMAVVTHLGTASLSTIDTPVFLGTGTVVVGSITVVEGAMASNILTQMQGQGAHGSNLSNLCTAIATGIASNILSAGTGTLVITGSPSGVPVPGTGTGVGTIA